MIVAMLLVDDNHSFSLVLCNPQTSLIKETRELGKYPHLQAYIRI